ncbi:MAG: TetR family transcriptional regulator [Alphaproteobacteria bacterium]|nr:TetR family transcriptional regulator [Alphaproteobacteria bacterium]
MVRKNKEDTEKTRELLLDAAESVFLEKGVGSASLEEIAKRAGVTRGALYWHFENKAALFGAVHERAKAPLDAFFDEEMQSAKDPIEALRASTIHVLQLLATDERMRNVFSIIMFRCEKPDEMSIAQNCCPVQKRMDVLAKFGRGFVKAHEEGRLVEGMTPELAAFALHAYVCGIFNDYLRYNDNRDLKKSAPSLMNIFFAGVLKKN